MTGILGGGSIQVIRWFSRGGPPWICWGQISPRFPRHLDRARLSKPQANDSSDDRAKSWRHRPAGPGTSYHGNLRGATQCHPPQEIAGLIKELLTVNHWFPLIRPHEGLISWGGWKFPLDCHASRMITQGNPLIFGHFKGVFGFLHFTK